MKVSTANTSLESTATPLLVLLFTEEQAKKEKIKPVQYLVQAKDFSGEAKQSRLLHKSGMKADRLLIIGLGKSKEVTLEILRVAMTSVTATLKSLQQQRAVVSPPTLKFPDKDIAIALTEGLILSDYEFSKKTENQDKKVAINEVSILTKYKNAVEETNIICENTKLVRDMQNENSNIMTTIELERRARELAKKHNFNIEVLDEKQIKNKGLNLLQAVGIGSQYPPRLIILQYNGDPKSKDTTAFIGKGITFDSGGYNIKPTRYIENMREDMTGAAIALAVIKTAAELKLKKNIIATISTAENAVSDRAYKPGDTYTAYDGTTVEIGNTDAEGRLVLADANAYTVKHYKPSRVINLATLTGAMIYVLGDYATGLFSNNDKLAQQMFEAGEQTAERVWRLPIYDEFKEYMKSDIADTNSITKGPLAGSSTAAIFLHRFVGKTDWLHLDLAGTSWLDAPRGYLPKNGTGVGVRLLLQYLQNT